MNIKYAIVYNFYRTNRLKKDGTASVIVRAYLNGRNKFFNSKVYVKPDQWDDENKRIINHPNSFYLNDQIRNQLQKMETYEFEVVRHEGAITLDRLTDYNKDFNNTSFIDFFQEQLEQSKLSRQSYTDQRQTLNKLQVYKKNVHFSELSFKLIKGFDAFLYRSGLRTNTIAKHHKNLKKYINLAIRFSYLDINKHPYKQFKIKKEPTERIYLTSYELEQFEMLKIPPGKDHWQTVKDFFLFCCYTGLRYSDASKLTVENLNITDNGIELYIKAQKTKKPLLLNLKKLFGGKPNELIRKYLEEYDDFYYDDPDKPIPIFFGYSNQFINRELKNLAELADVREVVKKTISIHSGRHTFGTIMANKVPIPILQRLMQHSKLKETMIYVHLNQQMIDQALDNIKW